MMGQETTIVHTVGFRHIVEDALAALRQEQVPAERQSYVLADLAEFLKEASIGCELVTKDAFPIGSAQKSAFECFSIVDEFLGNELPSRWATQLQSTESTLRELSMDQDISADSRESAIELISTLLESLCRERAFSSVDTEKKLSLQW